MMTREAAMRDFAGLVRQWGLQWTSRNIPQSDWDHLAEINEVLDTDDRREAIGLRRDRPHRGDG